MLQISTVIFRESLEIFLILGVIFAATKNLSKRYYAIFAGVFFGAMGAVVLAYSTSYISSKYDGFGKELFDISLLSLTIIMILFTTIWMRDRGTIIKQEISAAIEQAETPKTYFLLISMIAALFFREGAEIVLFVSGISTSYKFSIFEIFTAASYGLLSSIFFTGITYLGLFKLSGKYIFKITSLLLTLIAAGLVAEVINLFSSIGMFTSEQYWDSGWLIDDQNSIAGIVLKSMLGYNARPTKLQIYSYFFTIFSFLLIQKFTQRSKK